MARKFLAFALLLAMSASVAFAAKGRGPSTPEERARALNYARSLEEFPLAKDSLAKRLWLTEWLVNVPDFNVNICCQQLASLDKINDAYSNQLRMQALYSEAAFQLQHPEIRNPFAIQAAGLSGTLRAYRAIQRVDPTAKYPVLDNLISLERHGKLQSYLQEQAACQPN